MRADTRTLTLVADARKYDLVVPFGAPVSDVLAALGIGSSVSPVSVATPSGRIFGPGELLDDSVPDGTLLVVVPMTTHAQHRDLMPLDRSFAGYGRRRAREADAAGSRVPDSSTLSRARISVDDATRRRDDLPQEPSRSSRRAGRERARTRTRRPAPGRVPSQLLWALLFAAVAVTIVLALMRGPERWSVESAGGSVWAGLGPWATPALLGVILMILTAGYRARRISDAGRVFPLIAIPMVAIAAGLTLPWSGAGATGLGLLSGLVLTLTAFGIIRTAESSESEGVLILAVAVIAVVVGLGVMLGWPAYATAAVIAGCVPLAIRALPSVTLSVDPEHLVDVSRLSTTVWSARAEAHRPAGRLKNAHIRGTFGRARDITSLTTLYASIAVGISAWVVSLSGGPAGWQRYATLALFVVLTAGVGYQSRAVRDPLPRYAMATAAAVVAAAGAHYAVVTWPNAAILPLVITGLLLASISLLGAIALEGGYRSTRLSRLADVAEGFSVALSLPLAVVAAGGIAALGSLTAG